MVDRTKSVPRAERRSGGGTIINALVAIIFFGGLAMGIWWIFKQVGTAGQQYTTAMVNTSHKASALKCQTNLRSIYQSIQMYALSNEEFPASQERLIEYCGYSRLFRCDEPNTAPYVYIPDQRPDMPPSNVLVYEPEPVHEGRSGVLFLGGQIAMLTPEELKLALEATRAHVR
ncbi:MAG: hypothetical protein JSW27_03100 [Phycisphaerales bacterium]|nr:MAG: hypothetical protein JSW27_03100 [Phycisphaerales bacterium]